MMPKKGGVSRYRGKDLKPRKRWFRAALDENVPLTKRQAHRFANDLRYYLELNRKVKVDSVAFSWWEGAEVFKAFVKTEKRKSGTSVSVFESIGGPEVSLVVNARSCASWMLTCDPFNAEVLQKYFLEIAQVVEYTLIGTWEFHGVTLCCTQWGGGKGATIECCEEKHG